MYIKPDPLINTPPTFMASLWPNNRFNYFTKSLPSTLADRPPFWYNRKWQGIYEDGGSYSVVCSKRMVNNSITCFICDTDSSPCPELKRWNHSDGSNAKTRSACASLFNGHVIKVVKIFSIYAYTGFYFCLCLFLLETLCLYYSFVINKLRQLTINHSLQDMMKYDIVRIRQVS